MEGEAVVEDNIIETPANEEWRLSFVKYLIKARYDPEIKGL